jgi:hypothetical protein
VGIRTPGTELPERVERIRAALETEGARFVDAEEQPDDTLAGAPVAYASAARRDTT